MYPSLDRVRLGALILTMSAAVPGICRQPTESRIVAALVPVIMAAKSDSLTRVVVDSTQLVSTTQLSAAGIANLSRQVARGVKIGNAAHLVECQGAAGRFCSVVHIDELTDHGEFIVVRAGWAPFNGCGSYDASFKISLRDDRVIAVTRDDEDHGDCGGA